MKSGSQTVTALFDTWPLARVGGSKKKCLSAEHSTTLPYRVSSSRNFSYALTIVETGVKLEIVSGFLTCRLFTYHSADTASTISCGMIDVWTIPVHRYLAARSRGLLPNGGSLTRTDSVDGDVLFLRLLSTKVS